MSPPSEPSDGDLLNTARELSTEEISRVRRIGEAGWRHLQTLLAATARTSYSVADPADFAVCVSDHLDEAAREAMIGAEVFTCPDCGRLLKDRHTPVASSILLERRRVRDLWLDVEHSPPEQMDAALDRFRRALGLADPADSTGSAGS